jgi:hypothetical protein
VKFFVGLPEPSMAQYFDAAFISITRTQRRAGPFEAGEWIADSGAYTQVSQHGGYLTTPVEHAAEIRRVKGNGKLLAAVAQDYMCEPHVLHRTGLTVADHQRMTIERYDQLTDAGTDGVYVLPVLQGWCAGDYADHVEAYGARLPENAWVGVGSVCKRNTDPIRIMRVLYAIHDVRPDLRLHGFGLKSTALAFAPIRERLHTADSMAWSYAARKQGRDQNDWREAREFADRIAAGGET